MTTPDHGTDAVAEARDSVWGWAEQIRNAAQAPPLHHVPLGVWQWGDRAIANFEQAVRRAVLAECVHCGEREGAHADAYVCIPGAPDVAPLGTVFESRAAALARLLQHDVD